MFVLAHKNRVRVGPMEWNRGIFGGELEKLKINHLLSRYAPDELPLRIDQDTIVHRAEHDYPQHNAKIHYLEGPYWQLEEQRAVATYLVKDQPVDSVKYALKQRVAQQRWIKETAELKITVGLAEITVDTSRQGRSIYSQQHGLMPDGETVPWKFPQQWLEVSKSDLATIAQAVAAQITEAFAWEKQKHDEIDGCETLAQLDAVDLGEPKDPGESKDPELQG